MIDFSNPSTQYIIADLFAKLVDSYITHREMQARLAAERRRRLLDLAIGTVLGACGMGFALLVAASGVLL